MAELEKTGKDGWTATHDRFGSVTILRIPARRKSALVLENAATGMKMTR
jgi:hypothetical protein